MLNNVDATTCLNLDDLLGCGDQCRTKPHWVSVKAWGNNSTNPELWAQGSSTETKLTLSQAGVVSQESTFLALKPTEAGRWQSRGTKMALPAWPFLCLEACLFTQRSPRPLVPPDPAPRHGRDMVWPQLSALATNFPWRNFKNIVGNRALGRWRQEGLMFKVILGYLVSLWARLRNAGSC